MTVIEDAVKRGFNRGDLLKNLKEAVEIWAIGFNATCDCQVICKLSLDGLYVFLKRKEKEEPVIRIVEIGSDGNRAMLTIEVPYATDTDYRFEHAYWDKEGKLLEDSKKDLMDLIKEELGRTLRILENLDE